MTKSEIIRAFGQFSENELLDINRALIEEIKFKRDAGARIKRFQFAPGDKVQFDSRRNGLTVGEIVRVKRKKAIVKVGFSNWDVPLSMLTRAE